MSNKVAEILGEFLDKVDYSLMIISWATVDSATEITVENIYHLRKGMILIVDGAEYTTASISGSIITISGTFVSISYISIKKPFYVHGTPLKTNILLNNIKDSSIKTPMIYLLERLRERKYNEMLENVLEREADIQLFFLDNALGEWTTEQHYNDPVDRMDILFKIIEQEYYRYTDFDSDQTLYFDLYYYADFGTYLNNKGYVNHVFDNTFSGVEVRFKLPIKRSLGCNN